MTVTCATPCWTVPAYWSLQESEVPGGCHLPHSLGSYDCWVRGSNNQVLLSPAGMSLTHTSEVLVGLAGGYLLTERTWARVPPFAWLPPLPCLLPCFLTFTRLMTLLCINLISGFGETYLIKQRASLFNNTVDISLLPKII